MVKRFWLWGGGVLVVAGACVPPDGSENLNGGPSNDNSTIQLQLAPSLEAVAMIDPQGFEELLRLSKTEPRQVLQPLVDRYIRCFADFFSSPATFVMFTIDAHRENLRFTAVGGFNVTTRSPEAGLGPFVSATSFESLPNLRSYMYLARKDSLVIGPSLHEILHAWGVRLAAPLELSTQASDSGGHWGYSGIGGQLGGWSPGHLEDLGGGNFEVVFGNVEASGRSFNTVPYAPLEMYLSGLIDPREVQPFEVAVNPTFKGLFEFTADEIVEVAIEDILEGNGARVPDFENAERAFAAVLIVLTDHTLSESEWQFYQDSMDFFSHNEAMDIAEAFPESRYAGEPILEFIQESDPEDPARHWMNFFEATSGLATIEFLELQEPDGTGSLGK